MMTIYCMDKSIAILDIYKKCFEKVFPDVEISFYTDLPILVDAVLKKAPSLVVMDADATGAIVATKKIFDVNPNQNIIYSARTDKYSLSALQMNVSGYLVKPITEKNLKKEVEHLRFPTAI